MPALRTWLTRTRFKLRHFGKPATWFSPASGLTFRIDPKAFHSFRYFTLYDPAMIDELQAFIAVAIDKTCFIDIGAHYGLFSLTFSARNPIAKAFALEPSTSAFDILQRHCASNPAQSIEPLQIAAGETSGTLTMTVDFDDHVVAAHEASVENFVVAQVTLDELVAGRKIAPDLIKIDTEGFEIAVLKGAESTLRQHRPVLFLEIHPTALCHFGHTFDDVIRLLDAFNYDVFDVDRTTPYRRPENVDKLTSLRVIARPAPAKHGRPCA